MNCPITPPTQPMPAHMPGLVHILQAAVRLCEGVVVPPGEVAGEEQGPEAVGREAAAHRPTPLWPQDWNELKSPRHEELRLARVVLTKMALAGLSLEPGGQPCVDVSLRRGG